MKKFILKTILFCLPLLVLSVELFFPLNFFTYRPWEALLYTHTGLGYPFYPNQEMRMTTQGDLCYYTEHAIKKDEYWLTDDLGYRNTKVNKSPDVLIIGDSFIGGVGLTQDSTLTNLLTTKSTKGLTFYNIAPSNFLEFITLYESKVIRKPKVVIFSIVERNAPRSITQSTKGVLHKHTTFTFYKDKMSRMYSIEYLKGRLANRKGEGVQSPVYPRMFFYQDIKAKSVNADAKTTADIIISYKKYCDALGINFIFLPMPNKETVYYEYVPFAEQPGYLAELDAILKQSGVTTINTLALYNEYKKHNDALLYQLDDTHWNSTAANLVADEIVKTLGVNVLVSSQPEGK